MIYMKFFFVLIFSVGANIHEFMTKNVKVIIEARKNVNNETINESNSHTPPWISEQTKF